MWTSKEFEEMEHDAETLARICICTKSKALAAIIRLREQDLKIDLSPLLELVDPDLYAARCDYQKELDDLEDVGEDLEF